MILKYDMNYLTIQLEILKNKNMKQIAIFNYHQVGNKFDAIIHSPYTFTYLDKFEKQVEWIKKHYKLISLWDAIQLIDNNMIDDKYAVITFDDGDKSIFQAMKILEKHNIPASFFINSGYLDNKYSYWFQIYNFISNNDKYKNLITLDIKNNIELLRKTNNKFLYNKYRKIVESLFVHIQNDFDVYVKTNELKNINTDLFDIGLHGYEHQRFSMYDINWQKENLKKDIDILSKYISYKPIFAIPFGRANDWNNDTIKICIENDIKFVFADGGINKGKEIGYRRIPSDNQELKFLIKTIKY
jgi:peptidoglycan/xylan/chitin deacetylase (PgdA/CDA1 family)